MQKVATSFLINFVLIFNFNYELKKKYDKGVKCK